MRSVWRRCEGAVFEVQKQLVLRSRLSEQRLEAAQAPVRSALCGERGEGQGTR